LLLAALPVARLPVVGVLPIWGYVAATLVLMGCTLLAPIGVAAVAVALKPLPAPGPIWSLALRNFRRAVGRNGGAVAAVMVGMAMTIGVATMVGSFRETVKVWVGNTLPATFYLKPLAAEGTRRGLTLDPAVPAAIRRLPGVAAVETMRNQFVPYDGVTIRLGAGDADVLAEHGALVMRSAGDARTLYRQLMGTQAVIASEALAIKHGVHVGDEMRLPTPHGPVPFKVVGLFLDYSSDQGYVLMDRGTYARLWDDPTITDVAVYAAPGADAATLRGPIQQVLGDRPINLQASGELRDEVLRVFDNTFAITYALHLIAIAVSLLGVISTLFALVLERQRELSVMRYVGLTTAQVRSLVLAESGLLGLTGALVGLLCGGLLSAILIEVINKQSFGWSVDWHPPWGFILGAMLSLLVAALAAGLYPARVAARLPVAEGLRRE
jgi:putative ABC transport system permease protein